MKKCPHCSQLVMDVAVQCRFCGKGLGEEIAPTPGDLDHFVHLYKSSRDATRFQLWMELSDGQQEELVSQYGIEPPVVKSHELASPAVGPTKKQSKLWLVLLVAGVAWILYLFVTEYLKPDPQLTASPSLQEVRSEVLPYSILKRGTESGEDLQVVRVRLNVEDLPLAEQIRKTGEQIRAQYGRKSEALRVVFFLEDQDPLKPAFAVAEWDKNEFKALSVSAQEATPEQASRVD